MKWIDNLGVVVYTNESNFPILNLFLQYFYKYCPAKDVHVYVITNKVPDTLVYTNNVTYLPANAEWDSAGRHFSETLRNTLPQIKEEYILWFCEDYMLTDTLDIEALERLLKFTIEQKLDMFSFASIVSAPSFNPIQADYAAYNFEGEQFYYSSDSYMHKFSVQPCIWNKQSLINLVTENEISLHDLDCSRISEPEKYKVGCTHYRIFDICSTCPHRFIISYIEIIRHGVFQLIWNGSGVNEDYYWHPMIVNIILENDLDKKQEYKKYLSFNTDILRG